VKPTSPAFSKKASWALLKIAPIPERVLALLLEE